MLEQTGVRGSLKARNTEKNPANSGNETQVTQPFADRASRAPYGLKQ